MEEMSVIYVFVVVLLPILISIVALLYQMHKDGKDSQRESMNATARLTEAITNLRDEIRHMSSDNSRRDATLAEHENRLGRLEHDMTVVQTDMDHYHKSQE